MAALILAGCHPAIGVAQTPPGDRDDDDIPDALDRCPPDPCSPGATEADADGCPTPGAARLHVVTPARLAAADREALVDIGREAPDYGDEVLLIVTGHALPNEPPGPALERATAIALTLESDGVPLEHLLARAAGPPPPGDPAPGALVEITAVGCPATAPSASR